VIVSGASIISPCMSDSLSTDTLQDAGGLHH
jgi:hypothetical protein